MCQAIIWHPTADAGKAVSRNTATKGGGGGGATRALLAATHEIFHYTSSLGSLETISEEPESEQHEPRGADGPKGAFALEKVKHERGGGG